MTEEDLMKIPEYKAYLDAHPTEWIDDLIRNRLMYLHEVPMPSEGIWLWPRIIERFNEKGYEWMKEDFNLDKNDYDVSIVWESVPPVRCTITGKEYRTGAHWIFKMKVKRKKNVFD